MIDKLTPLNHFEGQKNTSIGQTQGPDKHLAQLVREVQTEANIIKLTSDAGAGGGATEAMTVTGLQTTDDILAVTQRVAGANGLAMTGWNTQIADGVTVSYTADPGAGSIVEVLVRRPLS